MASTWQEIEVFTQKEPTYYIFSVGLYVEKQSKYGDSIDFHAY